MENDACDTCGSDGYRNPAVAVDAVALREGESGTEALLIRRGGEPQVWQGRWGFPGGFVDYGEDPEHAVLRRSTATPTGIRGSIS